MSRTTAWVIARRDGDYLSCADKVPFVWSKRAPLVFRSKAAAQGLLASLWGPAIARFTGIRVTRL